MNEGPQICLIHIYHVETIKDPIMQFSRQFEMLSIYLSSHILAIGYNSLQNLILNRATVYWKDGKRMHATSRKKEILISFVSL